DLSPKERTDIETEIMQRATRVVVTSPQEKLDMVREYKVSNKNAVVIPPGTNLNNFFPLDKIKSRKKLGIDIDKKIVVFVSKMERRKGGLTFLKTIAEIKKKWPIIFDNMEVYFSSGDPRKSRRGVESRYDKELVDTINKNNLDKVIRYMRGLTRETLHYYYGAANVVVMPSYYEPFGMVATEAMATGTPVVASNVGGLKWNVEEGITGYHADPHDYKGFAKQIVKILNDEKLEKRLSENGIIRVNNNFSWKVVTKQMLKLYLEAVKEGKKK
ncbi:glycosyltransferase family 1 protein, partial [bacterium]|nr:glycosyltransferase family 1 protein [bacterium]